MTVEEKAKLYITARKENFVFTQTFPFTREGIEKLKERIDFLEKILAEYDQDEVLGL